MQAQQSQPALSRHTPPALAPFQQAASVALVATGIHQIAVHSHLTPLLIPMAHLPGIGHLSQLPTASQQAHGAPAHQQAAGQPNSPAPSASEVALEAGALVWAVHSVEQEWADGETAAHGLQADLGPLAHGLAGGTLAAAPSPTGQVGLAAPGAPLPRGPHGLAAVLQLLLPALTPPLPMALHTPPPVSDTSSLKFLAQVPALHQHEPTTPTVLPLQVARLLLVSWPLLLCSRWFANAWM
jgi:hypothetical protein